jgi:hypothetical protein
VELWRDVVRAANVFARPRKKGEVEGGEPNGEEGAGNEKPAWEGEREEPSEFKEGDRLVMGTARC